MHMHVHMCMYIAIHRGLLNGSGLYFRCIKLNNLNNNCLTHSLSIALQTHIQARSHTHTHTHTRARTHTHTHTYTYTYTHTHTHTHRRGCGLTAAKEAPKSVKNQSLVMLPALLV